MIRKPSPAFWRRFVLPESLRRNPYRLFFPFGMTAGILGVGHWALWTAGIPVSDIKNFHLILQSQGFLFFMVAGFLLTAFPRFSGTDPTTMGELATALGGGLIFLAGAFLRNWAAAHGGTFIVLAVILVFGLHRLPFRTKDLPPSFLLLGFGLFQAFLGTFFSLATRMGDTHLTCYAIGRQMVQLGFLLCMVLGVTAKLAPYLMGYTEGPDDEKSQVEISSGRGREVAVHGLAGVLILASFFLEPVYQRLSYFIRALVVTSHLLYFAKIYRPLRKKTATIAFFWISLWMIPLGLWAAFVLPLYRVAALHVVFIGGFSLMIFSFGLLVVLTHSSRAVWLNGKLWVLKIVGLLVFLALGFRVAADFWPDQYMKFLHNASGFWSAGALLWLVYAIRAGFKSPPLRSSILP